ncbi:hypothetical protein [Acinetobacter zhairhuonensis]|uniref:hypothetical protein n=1 Tax=Acinetobacter sp. A7.4 TaxID=2919921 RepID=UPI001F4F44A9|nr:hypothetical protein [Acinetobacter sp. A7.4]MCJ8163190.1 hypothetical protein [Acinetobacter sp. A7.4]
MELENKPAVNAVSAKPQMSLPQKIVITAILGTASVSSFAELTMPEVSVEQFVTYIGLLIAAVATVASANLMIPMVAKGIKAIRLAF